MHFLKDKELEVHSNHWSVAIVKSKQGMSRDKGMLPD